MWCIGAAGLCSVMGQQACGVMGQQACGVLGQQACVVYGAAGLCGVWGSRLVV